MADYGATLAFDDAEGLSDPKKTDPDKRALLLAGNRRGNTVPLRNQQAIGAGVHDTSIPSARVFSPLLVSLIPFWQAGQSLYR